jgi:hypothetical protein
MERRTREGEKEANTHESAALIAFPTAVMNKKILTTTLFILFGALLYEYSKPVILAKISEMAMRT